MHAAQRELNERWERAVSRRSSSGIGLSTGPVAAALLGSEERLEYTVVGDTVNLTQRLQQWAEPGETVLSVPTWAALDAKPEADELEPAMVKGRDTPVGAYRFPPRAAMNLTDERLIRLGRPDLRAPWSSAAIGGLAVAVAVGEWEPPRPRSRR